MLYSACSKVNLCFFVIFVEIKLISLQSQNTSPSTETENKIRSIVDDIQVYKFDFAQEQIIKLNDHSKIAQIIHDVYQNNETSFNEIFDFTKALTRVDVSFYVLKALRNEMVENSHRDPLKMIKVAKAFSNDVVLQKNNDEFIEAESKKIISDIEADVKISATETLTKAMLTNDYFLNGNAENVAEAIFNYRYSLSDEIMREMVNRTYPFVRTIEIIETIMRSSKFIPQKVSVFLEVFKKLEKDNDLDNEAILELASCVNQLQQQSNYPNLFHNQKYDINIMLEKIPTCARNLFFAKDVCIWNRAKMEYLYSPVSQNRSSRSANVYTCPAADLKALEGSWRVEQFLSDFLFKSQTNTKQYLGNSENKFDWQARYAHTMENIEDIDHDSNIWKIELLGEFCFLKNQRFDEYLFASDERQSKRERLVFSAPAVANIDPNYFQWQIRDCS